MYVVDAIGAFSISVANLIFWLLILPKQYHRPIVRSYFVWSLFITLWSFGYGITLAGFYDYPTTLIWNRYCQAMATLIGPFYFKFACSVVGVFERYQKLFRVYLAIGIVSAFCLFVSPYYVQGLWSFGTYRYQPLGGPLYFLFTGYFLWCTTHGFGLAWKHYSLSRGIDKKHVQLFLWASGIGYSGGFTLFLQGYKIPIPTTGVYLILAYMVIIGYSVFKYRFMDIELIIKKTLIFAGLFSFIFGLFAFFSFILTDIFQQGVTPLMRWLLFAAATAVIALTVRRMELFLVNLTDRFLFQKKYNYHKLLKENSKQISLIQSMDEMAKQVVAFLITQGRIRNAGIFVQSYDQQWFELKYPLGYGGKTKRPSLSLGTDHPLVQLLLENKTSLVLEDITKESASGNKNKGLNIPEADLDEVLRIMRQLKAEVIIPSFCNCLAD